MKTDLFQSCGHCWVFQICWHIECSTFTSSYLRIQNSSIRIPSPPLTLFTEILPKACLTSLSRMCDFRWVVTQSWLSGSLGSFSYSSSVYLCYLILISSASDRSLSVFYCAYLCMKCSLGISNFLEEILQLIAHSNLFSEIAMRPLSSTHAWTSDHKLDCTWLTKMETRFVVEAQPGTCRPRPQISSPQLASFVSQKCGRPDCILLWRIQALRSCRRCPPGVSSPWLVERMTAWPVQPWPALSPCPEINAGERGLGNEREKMERRIFPIFFGHAIRHAGFSLTRIKPTPPALGVWSLNQGSLGILPY